MPNKTVGLILVVIAGMAFGALPIFARIAYADGVDPFTLLFLRFLIAGTIMLAIALLRRDVFPRGKTLLGLMLMGSVLYVGQSLTYFIAITMASAGLISLLLFLNPGIVTLLSAVFFKEHITRLQWVALALALLGSGLTVGGDAPNSAAVATPNSTLGIILGLSAGVIYAIYITVGGYFTRGISAVAASAVIMLSAFAVFAVITWVRGAHWPHSGWGWFGIGGLALVSSIVAIFCFFAGVQRVGAATGSMIATTEPVTTIVLAALVLGEPIAPIQALGGAFILSAVFLLARR
ncbi:MAG: DMT family transporter [Anaerolineae bacterium]|nr:DMT family transporter [Anaerolineae bacterium]